MLSSAPVTRSASSARQRFPGWCHSPHRAFPDMQRRSYTDPDAANIRPGWHDVVHRVLAACGFLSMMPRFFRSAREEAAKPQRCRPARIRLPDGLGGRAGGTGHPPAPVSRYRGGDVGAPAAVRGSRHLVGRSARRQAHLLAARLAFLAGCRGRCEFGLRPVPLYRPWGCGGRSRVFVGHLVQLQMCAVYNEEPGGSLPWIDRPSSSTSCAPQKLAATTDSRSLLRFSDGRWHGS